MDARSIETIKGIGKKTASLFASLGVATFDDLIHFYPVRYDAYTPMISIEEAIPGENAAVCARIASRPHTIRGKRIMTEAYAQDYSGKLRCLWYNAPFMASQLVSGEEYVLSGRISEYKGKPVLLQPAVYRKEEYEKMAGRLKPVYRLCKGLKQKTVVKAMECVLAGYAFEEDYLPVDLRDRYDLCDSIQMLKFIHFPDSRKEAEKAHRRAAFDEFFQFLYSLRKLKRESLAVSAYRIDSSNIPEEFDAALPFRLTKDQAAAGKELLQDMACGKCMNRLLQGDVGSGKTAVALLAAYAVFRAGYQTALMVPTEVLARQHEETCEKLFSAFSKKPVIRVITGSMSAGEKRRILGEITDGSVDLVIGTHALIQTGVSFRNLALVITDEQHRFGVRQRELLSAKGCAPHILVMSATPIPRTLAVILYGDLDVSLIRSRPEGRLPVKNAVIHPADRGKAYRTLLNEIEKGHQAYVICPLVEESELTEAENVVDYTAKLRGILPHHVVIQYLHGRMKPPEKDEIMRQFVHGKIQILVSTTVIEVGVDVPNATVMMIENADRFGLAALHQLRGRIGRGNDQSYCIFVQTSPGEKSDRRLQTVGSSNDGFFIAQEDLRLRGPGEILGEEQSGEIRFAAGDIYHDADILQDAYDCVNYIETGAFVPDDEEWIRLNRRIEAYREKALNNINL